MSIISVEITNISNLCLANISLLIRFFFSFEKVSLIGYAIIKSSFLKLFYILLQFCYGKSQSFYSSSNIDLYYYFSFIVCYHNQN